MWQTKKLFGQVFVSHHATTKPTMHWHWSFHWIGIKTLQELQLTILLNLYWTCSPTMLEIPMNKTMNFKMPCLPLLFPSMLPPSAGASASVETESCDAARAREDSGRKRGLPPCRWELQLLVRTGWVGQKPARNLSSAKWPNMWVEQTCLNMCILWTQTSKWC